MDDRSVVERQLGRPPRAFRRVVRRCPFGFVAVSEQAPYDSAGNPFPTTYYLTCPHLVAAVSRVEAAGGVERWSDEAARDPALADSLQRATEEQRAVRRNLARGLSAAADRGASLELGIAGARRPERLKCLHAHVAFALARPGYELGERIVAELEPLWPPRCCTEPLVTPAWGQERGGDRLASRPVDAAVEHARQEWEASVRRLAEEAGDHGERAQLLAQVDVVSAELRRRIGETFTLAELAREYARAEAWTRQAVEETDPPPGWAATLSLVEGAAFHAYARGAVDYEP